MRGVFQRRKINAIQDLGMQILYRQKNIEANKLRLDSQKMPVSEQNFWIKVAALGILKISPRGGKLYPAYDPKKLFPEYFTTTDEREQAEESERDADDLQNVDWQSPSMDMDDWAKTEALLKQFAQVSVVDNSPVEEEPSEDTPRPTKKVGATPPPVQGFTAEDAEWM